LVVAELANESLTPSAVTSFVKLSTAGLTSAATTSTLDVVTTSVATAGTTAGYILVGNRILLMEAQLPKTQLQQQLLA